MGFQSIFCADMQEKGIEAEFINEEIMEYKPHLGSKDFNSQDFINFANDFDLIIIGGGGFFSAFPAYGNSGCHVDFTFTTLDQIKTPIVYYALGFSTYYGQKYYHTDRLEALLQYAQKNGDRLLVSVRNDGSYDRLKKFIKSEILQSVEVIADGGFFVPVQNHHHLEIEPHRMNIGIQLAGDKTAFRFREVNSLFVRVLRRILKGHMEVKKIRNELKALQSLAHVAERLVREYNANIILCPHIHKDLEITGRFISLLPDDIARFHLKIAGIYRGNEDALKQFDLYRKMNLVLAMRFHSNVCSFALGTPSVGLVTHDQLDEIYKGLKSDSFVYLSDRNLEEKLWDKIQKILKDPEQEKSQRLSKVQDLRKVNKNFHAKIFDLAKWQQNLK